MREEFTLGHRETIGTGNMGHGVDIPPRLDSQLATATASPFLVRDMEEDQLRSRSYSDPTCGEKSPNTTRPRDTAIAGQLYALPARRVVASSQVVGRDDDGTRSIRDSESPAKSEEQKTIEKMLLEIDSLKEQLKRRDMEVATLTAELKKNERQQQEQAAEFDAYKAALQDSNQKPENVEQERKYMNIIKTLTESNTALGRQIDDLRMDKKKLEERIENLQSQLSRALEEREEDRRKIACLESGRGEDHHRLERLEATCSELSAQDQRAQAERTSLKDNLQQQILDLRDEVQSCKLEHKRALHVPDSSSDFSDSQLVPLAHAVQVTDEPSSEDTRTLAFGRKGDINLPVLASVHSVDPTPLSAALGNTQDTPTET